MEYIDKSVRYIESIISYCIQKINLSPTWLVLFILFIGNFLSFIPESNEEQYMQFSKLFYNPEWVPGAFNIAEFAGSRILYECFIGFLLNALSFETVAFIGKLFICTGYAIIISGTIKRLNISNIQAVFILQVVFFSYPWFFSGEYLLPGIEPKHFAYLFILTAINKIMDGKYMHAVLLVIGACWFHMLVGGWFFIALMLYFLWTKEESFWRVCIYSVLCIVCLSPLIYYLVNGIIVEYHPVKNGISGNWIYSYVRVPHHTGIFKSIDFFHDHHLKGVLWTAIAMLSSLFVFSTERRASFNRINKFLFSVTLLLLINVVIAYFDRTGGFVKYYPFRLTPVSAYLFFLVGFTFLFENMKENGKAVINFLFISSGILFVYLVSLNVFKNYRSYNRANDAFYQMSAFVKKNTPKDAVIYYADQSEDYRLTFTRVAERDRFFVYKSAPAGTDKIYEWYDRMLVQEKIDKDPSAIFEAKKKYKIDYVLTTDSIYFNKIDLVKSIPPYLLYQF
jgi:hypothetical protein